MLAYNLMILLSCGFAALHDLEKRISYKKKKFISEILFWLSGVPLWIVSAFRSYSVGVDTFEVYFTDYVNIESGLWAHSDFGFQLINRIAIDLHLGFRFVLIVSSFIFIFGALALIADCSKNLLLPLMLLIFSFNYFQSLSLIAQYTAIGVLCFALKELLKNNLIRSIIITFIASSFHVSALYFIVIIIVYVFFQKNKNKVQSLIFISSLTLVIALFSSIIIPFIVENTRYKVYLNTTKYSDLSSMSQVVINISVAVFVFVSIIIKNRKEAITEKDCILVFLQVAAALFALAQWEVVLLVRFVMYLSFYQYVSITYFISNQRYKNITQTLIILAYILWFYLFPIDGNYYNILPYTMLGV